MGIPPQSLSGDVVWCFPQCDQSSLIFFSKFVDLPVVVPLAAKAQSSLRVFSDHQMLKMHLRVQSRFNFEFFTLFCNGFTTFSASKSADEEAELVESVVLKFTRYKNKWAYGIFEQWQKQRLIKLPNVQSQWFVQRLQFPFGSDIFDRDECLVFKLLPF